MKWIFIIFAAISLSVYAQETAKIKSVNFIQDGEVSKLIIDLNKPVFAERTHIKEDKQIILDVNNVIAEKKTIRGIDTSEFSGSAVYVSPYKKPGSKSDIRFAIQLRDNVRSFLETKGRRLILHIENRYGVFSKTKLDKAEKLSSNVDISATDEKINVPKSNTIEDILENLTQSGVKKYIGKKISINVNDLGYREILRMIADTSGFNIIIDDDINSLKPLTLSLTNIPWDQALDTVLGLGGLVAIKYSNILTIKTAQKAREEKQRELDNRKNNIIEEPLVTKIFPISFADNKSLIDILKDYSTEARGKISLDERTSNLIVKDTVEVIERMKKIVETLDTQTPQILIESRIIEASENYEFRAGLANGVNFNYNPLNQDLGANDGIFSFSSAPTAAASNVFGATINVYKNLLNLNFSLELMESEQKGRIVSSPKIITENNKAATISSSETRFVRVLSDENNESGNIGTLEEITATINLTVTPRVTNDGSILMELNLQKGSFLQTAAGQAPNTLDRTITTNVLVDNGATVVVGGLYSTEDNEVQSGIPFLKDLPLVGWLFKTAYNPKKIRNEMMVFITPRVINQEEAGLVNRDDGILGI